MTHLKWRHGNDPGKTKSIHFLVAIRHQGKIVYDVLFRSYKRHKDSYEWVDFNYEINPIIGFVPLTEAIEWCTYSSESPQVIDTVSRQCLNWSTGEISDTSKEYIVSLTSQYDVQKFIDGERLLPPISEADYGYNKYIEMNIFLDYTEKYFPFSS